MPEINDSPSITTEPRVLKPREAQPVTVTLTNRGAAVMEDVVLSTRGGVSIQVSPRSVRRDRLAPGESWVLKLEVRPPMEAGAFDLPVRVAWRGVSDRYEAAQSLLEFQVIEEPSPSPGLFRAFITAVDEYRDPRLPGLRAAAGYARALADVLALDTTRGYGRDRVMWVPGPVATALALQAQINSFGALTHADETVLVYISGYAGQVQERGCWTAYLCLRDSVVDALPDTAFPVADLVELLVAIPAARVLAILDLYHGGVSAPLKTLTGYLPWRPGPAETDLIALGAATERAVIAACQAVGVGASYAPPDDQPFARHIVEAFRGASQQRTHTFMCVQDLFGYVTEAPGSQRVAYMPVIKPDDLQVDFPITGAPAR